MPTTEEQQPPMSTQNGPAPAPAQPKGILRGHRAQVHAAAFVRDSERLVTGDADGFAVAWDLTVMRPKAVWRAHANTILGIAAWGTDRVITYVRTAGGDAAAMRAFSPSLPPEAGGGPAGDYWKAKTGPTTTTGTGETTS